MGFYSFWLVGAIGWGLRVVGRTTSWGCLFRGTDLVVDWACPALCHCCSLGYEFMLCCLLSAVLLRQEGSAALPASPPWRGSVGSAVEMRRNHLSKSFGGGERLAQGDGFFIPCWEDIRVVTSIQEMKLKWARMANESAAGLVKWKMKCDDEDIRYWWGMISAGYLSWEQGMQIPADLGRHLSKSLKSMVLKAADRSETISMSAWSLAAIKDWWSKKVVLWLCRSSAREPAWVFGWLGWSEGWNLCAMLWLEQLSSAHPDCKVAMWGWRWKA